MGCLTWDARRKTLRHPGAVRPLSRVEGIGRKKLPAALPMVDCVRVGGMCVVLLGCVTQVSLVLLMSVPLQFPWGLCESGRHRQASDLGGPAGKRRRSRNAL